MTPEALRPSAVIGIVGGGQLGRMLAMAAAKLGFRTSIFAPEPDSPAFDVAAFSHCAAYDDTAALERFAREADAVTYEFESIPVEALTTILQHSHLAPGQRALKVAQHRLEERRFLTMLGLPCAPYKELQSADELPDALGQLLLNAPSEGLYLKRARFGYDGKGQMTLRSSGDLPAAQEWLGDNEAVLEMGVAFRFEFSVICVRDRSGQIAFYDPPENRHQGGILRESLVPANLPCETAERARGYAKTIADALDYEGVLAVEMFAAEQDGKIVPLINELAPRVHNSGHWTVEACQVSQFENQIRAVAGWPLGSTARHSNARMVNLLGEEANGWQSLLAEQPGRSLTLYGKKDALPGRKMGHYVDIEPITKG